MHLCDLHNHTYFSYDGSNSPEEVIENALANDISVIGITDHQFSIGSDINKYIKKINECKEKYKRYITVLCGLEIGTRPKPNDFIASRSAELDYCLFESTDSKIAMDFFEFIEWIKLFKCPVGLAHTDIFALEERYGVDIFKVLSENNIFWEINTSGNYNYYYDFITNIAKRERVKNSGITISLGSDTHWIGDFSAVKLKSVYELIKKLGNPIIFDNI